MADSNLREAAAAYGVTLSDDQLVQLDGYARMLEEWSQRALGLLGARAITIPLRVAGPKQQIIVAAKQRATPEAYPRRPGVPAKQPL